MSSLYFLGIAVAISVIGLVILGIRGRRTPTWESGIDDFRQNLDALRPTDEDPVQWAIREVTEGGSSPGT